MDCDRVLVSSGGWAKAKGPQKVKPPNNPNANKVIPVENEHDLIVDIKSIASVPHEPSKDGVRAFRAIRLPKGKACHVPNVTGAYVVNGDWLQIISPAIVYFKAQTARKPQLVTTFIDFGQANGEMSGISIESVPFPLMVKKNTYQKHTMITSVKDVIGFRVINVGMLPFSAHLQPCLSSIQPYKSLNIYKPMEVLKLITQPLANRIPHLSENAEEALEAEVEGIRKQDDAMANKIKAAALARLHPMLLKLTQRPCA